MQLSIFTIYDEKAKAHLMPFLMNRSEQALRAFQDCINNPEHTFNKHPSDYTLFIHGSFEDENAEFTLQSAPKPLGNGVEFIDRKIKEERNVEVGDDPYLSKHALG